MNALKLSTFLLRAFIAFGTYGAISISYNTLTQVSPCPAVSGFPVCYLVLAGYLAMLVSLFLTKYDFHKGIFYIGWFIVFLIAIVGTIYELYSGNICPRTSYGLPMCYLSLAFTLLIVFLFKYQQKLIAGSSA